jgi:G protein-coupled receptor GPR1
MPSGEYSKSTLWLEDPVYGLIMADGHLTGHESEKPTLTGEQLYILRSIALASASVSVVSGVLVGWWFARMKRSFRHQ